MSPARVRGLRRAALAPMLAIAAALPVTAAEPPSAAVARDPGAAWERFLAEADAEDVHPAYAVLTAVAYDGQHVDADACVREAGALDAALAVAPVGIALQRVALQCAEAMGDAAAADAAADALSALARLALAGAGDADWSPPIRIVRIEDAYALLQTAGLEARYAYFHGLHPRRHFPLRIAAWDAAEARERDFTFDFVDVGYRISRAADNAGFPQLRVELVDAWIDALAPVELAAVDHRALLQATRAAGVEAKVAALRDAAAAGGLQSTRAWIILCLRTDEPGCGEGLVDAILPHAEATWPRSMAQLAVAYASGLGVERDQGAAEALLAAAGGHARAGDAEVEYLSLHAYSGNEAQAAASRERLRALAAEGHPGAILAFMDGDTTPATWPEGLAARLAGAPFNDAGIGARLLAGHHRQLGNDVEADAWRERAAALGDSEAQSGLGFALLEAGQPDDAQQLRGAGLLREAAQGGDVGGARYSAMQAARNGRRRDAETWLLPAVRRGSAAATIDLVELVVWQDEPVTRVSASDAITILRGLADADNGTVEARRLLATVLLEGAGTDKAPAEAEALLRADAEAGDATSMVHLGGGYLRGLFGTRDVAAGRAWMERAVALGEPDAHMEFGNGLVQGGESPAERAEGLEWWAKGHEAGYESAGNNLAWALCTSPHADVLDARRGRALAEVLEAQVSDPGPGLVDTLAACHAADGDHARAVLLQQRAIDMLSRREDGSPDDRSGFGDRLALYRSGKAYIDQREP